MSTSRKIVERNARQQNQLTAKQLSVTDLNNVAHGEERISPMRNGFYTRRNRSQI